MKSVLGFKAQKRGISSKLSHAHVELGFGRHGAWVRESEIGNNEFESMSFCGAKDHYRRLDSFCALLRIDLDTRDPQDAL